MLQSSSSFYYNLEQWYMYIINAKIKMHQFILLDRKILMLQMHVLIVL